MVRLSVGCCWGLVWLLWPCYEIETGSQRGTETRNRAAPRRLRAGIRMLKARQNSLGHGGVEAKELQVAVHIVDQVAIALGRLETGAAC